MRLLLILFFASSFVLWLACTGATPESNVIVESGKVEGKRIASADVVSVKSDGLNIAAGGSAEAIVKLQIQSGYHVNANPPTEPYLKPTELVLNATDGITVDFVIYPDAVKRTFSFANQPLAVYEGETIIKVALKADSTAVKGARHLSGKVRIQACDDEVCYPPGTVEVSIPLTVM